MPVEVLDLNVGHSIIKGHKPDNLPMEAIERIQKETNKDNLMSFGIFDTASPNYLTYYPEVKPEDLNPNEVEFIYPVFRLLSEIVIYPTKLAIDFTESGVLKKSMYLLKGQTIFVDHEMITGNAMGSIADVTWQEGYEVDGVKVPAGINGVLKLDGKSNPRIARAIMMNPPAIHSSSVQIQFAWEPSHRMKDENDFYSKLGTYDNKGVLIRKVVKEVLRYAENSLVPHGMDPFAKKMENGKIVLAKQSQRIYSMQFSEAQFKKEPDLVVIPGPNPLIYHSASLSFSEAIDTSSIIINKDQHQNPTPMFETLIAALKLSAEKFADEAALVAYIVTTFTEKTNLETQIQPLNDQITTLTGTIAERDTTITSLTGERDSFKTLAEGEIGKIRAEAKKFYGLVKGDKRDAAILALIDLMDVSAASAFLTEWKSQYETAVPMVCQDCHSTNVARKASGGTSTTPTKNFMESLQGKAAEKAVKDFVS